MRFPLIRQNRSILTPGKRPLTRCHDVGIIGDVHGPSAQHPSGSRYRPSAAHPVTGTRVPEFAAKYAEPSNPDKLTGRADVFVLLKLSDALTEDVTNDSNITLTRVDATRKGLAVGHLAIPELEDNTDIGIALTHCISNHILMSTAVAPDMRGLPWPRVGWRFCCGCSCDCTTSARACFLVPATTEYTLFATTNSAQVRLLVIADRVNPSCITHPTGAAPVSERTYWRAERWHCVRGFLSPHRYLAHLVSLLKQCSPR